MKLTMNMLEAIDRMKIETIVDILINYGLTTKEEYEQRCKIKLNKMNTTVQIIELMKKNI